MPIAPIQQYQDPSNSLMQILQGGNQQIGSILDRAIQIGRDIANKRTQQEQDLAAMRNQETAMAQRRGENLQSVLETQRKFGMEQDKFDFLRMDTQRKYDANRIDEGTRAMEKDAAMQQQQSQFDQSYGLSERRVAVDEAEAQRRADAVAAEQQRLEAAATPPAQATTGPTNPASATPFEVAGPVNVLAAPNTTGKTFVSPLGRAMTATGSRPFVNAAEGGSSAPTMDKLLAVPSNVTGGAVKPYTTLEREYQEAVAGKKAAVARYGSERASAMWDPILSEKESALSSASGEKKPLTVSEQIQLERLRMAKEKAAQGPQGSSLAVPKAQVSAAGQAFGQLVEGSPDAFVNTKADRFAPKGESEKDKERRQAEAEKLEKNKVALERQSALGMSEDEYVASVLKPISDPKSEYYIADPATRTRIENERRRAHRLAMTEKSAQGTLMGGAPAATASPVDFLKRQH